MRINALLPFATGLGLWFAASSGFAHHSFASAFDVEKPFTVVGTVTEVAWRNPHAYFYIDVEDDSGAVSNWGMELVSANQLMRSGLTPTSMKVGDVVTVEGFQARDGSNTGSARTVTLNATGEVLLRGQNAGRAREE